MRRIAVAMAVAMAVAATWIPLGAARAQSLQVEGYLDLRAATTSGETSWLDGGLGKARFGGGDDAFSGSGAMTVLFQATPALLATATLQAQPELPRPVDVTEAYLRYRPVSTTPWRWSVKAGAFFPPVSLEHDGVGWSTTRTLTPSAVNSWAGEELRIIGAEALLEHRGRHGTLEARAVLFFGNDPAGELLGTRGWALGDVAPGLGGSLRQPDVYAPVARAPLPMRFRPFVEMDDRPGAYAALAWRPSAQRRIAALYYDNRADLAGEEAYAGRTVHAWRTYFWSLGGEQRFGEWVLLAQGMHGSTVFEPVPGRVRDTDFNAGYLMLARDHGTWRPTVRVDLFQAKQQPAGSGPRPDEHGNALTLALNWRPHERLRVTGEWLRIDSDRDQRRRGGLATRQLDTQLQLGLRVFF